MGRAGVCIDMPGIIYSMLVPSQVLRPKTLRGGKLVFGSLWVKKVIASNWFWVTDSTVIWAAVALFTITYLNTAICACCIACVGICCGVAYCYGVAYCDHVNWCNCLCGMVFVLVYVFRLFSVWVLVVLVWWLWEHPWCYHYYYYYCWCYCYCHFSLPYYWLGPGEALLAWGIPLPGEKYYHTYSNLGSWWHSLHNGLYYQPFESQNPKPSTFVAGPPATLSFAGPQPVSDARVHDPLNKGRCQYEAILCSRWQPISKFH